ncbi:flotillin family protein [Crocosphaera sp. UHCC 0190]|uniref:flotillin family protein n=1 Tax=Crocosphaera sp. UHCC 0190 TaxID=3110246 RepID=UPI002B1F5A79|nr:flotillin family protein [Crocosphaera sp. UHCC 0190]MEA5509630.1 flotillin family protein [Crocosphaera sp. UHCC 0190]
MNPKLELEIIKALPKTFSFDEELNLENKQNNLLKTDSNTVVLGQNIPVNSAYLSQLGGATNSLPFVGILGSIGILLFLLLLSVWIYTRFYVIAPNNEALVRTGGIFQKSKRVILNGGCIVIPGFHEITRVPLREISIDVVRSGNLAVRTQDYLRANMRVTFYVCIAQEEKDILSAAARLSKQGKISESDIKDAIEKRADDAIRAAAKKKRIAEIDSDKLGFAEAVLNLIQQDLKKVGLTLNNIAISEIEESDTYDENNFFDAQGVRLRTETIQRAIQQKREVELETKVAIEQRELDAEKQTLEIAKQKEDANLTQQKDIEFFKAQQQREIQETKDKEAAKIERNKILQEQAIEEERIQKQLVIQQKNIAANIELEEQNKQLKVAQILQKQEAEVAEITRQKMIQSSQLEAQAEIAAAEQKSKITQQQAAIAIAQKERERFESEAEKAQAEAAVVTAQEVEKAQREQKLVVILAEQEAQKIQISEQNVVELDVFRRRRQAEIARQAAELEAASIRTLADADKYKMLAEAQSKQALIEAENAFSNANRTADLIKTIWPELASQLPQIVKSLAPQPGVLGDARIYAFPGLNGNNGKGSSSTGDINKLLLSTSGLSLINTLLDEGKLGSLLNQVKTMLSSEEKTEVKSTVAATPSNNNPDLSTDTLQTENIEESLPINKIPRSGSGG